MKPTDERLLPCPFCGNADDFEGSPWPSANSLGEVHWKVRCGNPSCNADVLGGTPEQAISMWNRRTPTLNESPWQGIGCKLVPVVVTKAMERVYDNDSGAYQTAQEMHDAMLQACLPPPKEV